MKDINPDPKWLDALTVPRELKSSDYEFKGDREALAAFKAVPGAAWFCSKWVEFWLEFRKSGFLGSAVKVSDKQFPEVNRLRVKCAEILGLEPPPVFIVEHPVINAYTMGTDDKNSFIGITRQLVEVSTEKELMFILGHEMGHIKSQHALYATIAIVLANLGLFYGSRLPLAQLLVYPAEIALRAWFRRSEITCDRAGLLCAQDLSAGRKALMLLGCCSRELADRIDLDEFRNQSKEMSKSYGKWSELFLTHPYLPKRIRCLETFADSHLFVRRVVQDYRSTFMDNADVDTAVDKILGNDEPDVSKRMETKDAGRLRAAMALAGAWSDGEVSEGEAKVLEGLLKKGIGKKESEELKAYLEKPFTSAQAAKEVRYFTGDRLQGLPYAFSLTLMDAKGVSVKQTKLLTELSLACGLPEDHVERVVYDVAARKLLFRDRCGSDICAGCATLFEPQLHACPACKAKSTSLDEPDERKIKRLAEKLSEIGTTAAQAATEMAGGLLRTLVKGLDAASDRLQKSAGSAAAADDDEPPPPPRQRPKRKS